MTDKPRFEDMQIKTSEIPKYREEYEKKQDGKCAICKCKLDDDEVQVNLDHSHTTGYLRGALCRACNSMEGKVINSRYRAKRSHLIWTNPALWVYRLYRYLKHHDDNPSGIYHPTFDVEKGRQKTKKRKKRRGKSV